ncbi:MAG: hypothetical protein ACK5IP_00005 [Paracoccus sp. (in: a-proteobacteria)]
MSGSKYVIVGNEVDQAEYFLHDDGSIDDQKGDDGQPLNVEFVGKLMVDLSRRGPDKVSEAELLELGDQVKYALTVQDFSERTGGSPLTDAEKAQIMARTTVKIVFEPRYRVKHRPDRNLRLLIVPCDETLEVADHLIRSQGDSRGFRPPLSYEIDKALILASLEREIVDMVREFGTKQLPGWTQSLQDELEKHVKNEIKERSEFRDAGGNLADDVKNEIMTSPIRAFHRSVGIYATNACR